MRQLILTLAMQGKLVPQCPDDEPATVLVAKLKSTEITENGRLRKVTSLPELTIDELPFDLPPGWVWQRLGCVGETNIGLTYSPNDLAETGVPVLRSSNIQNGKLDFGDIVRVKYEPKKSVMVQNGDLLICARNGSKALVGKVAVIENLTEPAAFGAFMAIFRSRINQYLYYFISSPLFRRMIDEVNTTTINQITQNNLRTTLAPIPPLAEQKRIVAKVEELMGLCDELEAQQQERELRKSVLVRSSLSRFAESPTRENLGYLFHNSYDIPPSELRKSILTLAVQGKLVLQDPEDEPAALALERIDAAPKRAMRTRASDNGDGDEPTELEPLFELPPGWEWVPFGRLPLQASVGIDRGRSMQGPEKAVGYFKMNNIRNSGGVDLSDLTRIDATTDEIKTYLLVDGDFLFNTRNSRELVGKTCVYRSPPNDTILYNNNILRVRFIEGFSPDFIDYWFRSPEGSAELENLKSNTTNVCAIYQGKLTGFPCVVPPLAEQHRIVAKVDQLMALVDELERQQAASREKASNLLDAIVQEMTSGG
jgi:type I restriction enzyme S subunit